MNRILNNPELNAKAEEAIKFFKEQDLRKGWLEMTIANQNTHELPEAIEYLLAKNLKHTIDSDNLADYYNKEDSNPSWKHTK